MNTSEADSDAILVPPDCVATPAFSQGWIQADGTTTPYLAFVADGHAVNWSDELEALHEESSRTHFIDVFTRSALLDSLHSLPESPLLVDLGCSTGHLLEDLRVAHPGGRLVGIDLISSGLRKAHAKVPEARLLQADLCNLPLADSSVDGVVSANVLEHVAQDARALAEVRRVLRPGAHASFVVPAGPRLFDYYDRFLGHERRYGRRELAGKALDAGLEVIDDYYVGSLIHPAFCAKKLSNRRRFDHLRGRELEMRVARDIERTRDSRLGYLACSIERAAVRMGVRLRFGIRNVVVTRKPEEQP